MSNAISYTSAGGVLVAARRRGDALHLQVWDTGPGIPAAQLEVLSVGDVSLGAGIEPAESEHLGIGLVASAQLARLLGGELRFYSREGRGTLAELVLPAARSTPAGAVSAA